MWLWSHHLLFWRKVANASEDPIRLLGHKSTLMAHGQPLIHQDLVVLLCKAPFQQVSPKPILMNVAIPPQIYNSTLAFVEHYTFFSAQLSSLSRSCWKAAQPSGVSITPCWICILSPSLSSKREHQQQRITRFNIHGTTILVLQNPHNAPWGLELLFAFLTVFCLNDPWELRVCVCEIYDTEWIYSFIPATSD